MVKRLSMLFATGLVLSWLTACTGGSSVITIGEIDASRHEIRGEYESFSGNYFKKIKLNTGETLIVNFTAHTSKGEVLAKVINSDGKTIATLHGGDTAEIHQPGQFKMQVEGQKHKGSFVLSWDIE